MGQSSKDDARVQRLAALVDELLSAAAKYPGLGPESDGPPPSVEELTAELSHKPIRSLAAENLFGNPGVTGCAMKILEELGKGSAFEAPWEVAAFLSDRLEEIQERDPDYEVESSRLLLAASLTDPLRKLPFVFVLQDQTELLLEQKIGGPHELEMACQPHEKGHRIVLGGMVTATTREGAVRSVERVADAVMGALRAAGLASLTPARAPGGTLRVVVGSEPFWMAAVPADRVASLRLQPPDDLDELERSQVAREGEQPAHSRRLKLVRKALAGSSPRAIEVRNACRLAVSAEHSMDFGVLVTLAFACLEGLLLSRSGKEDVVAKLSEAVAHSLGSSYEEVEALRKQVKRLYDLRSDFAHTGQSREDVKARRDVLALLFRVLRKQIQGLPEVDPA